MIKITDVLGYLKKKEVEFRYEGAMDFAFETYCPLNTLKKCSITWTRDPEKVNIAELNSVEGIILVADLNASFTKTEFPVLYVKNPHRSFFRILEEFFSAENPEHRVVSIARTAIVETEAIGEALYVGHHTYIGADVKIGNRVRILNNVTIQGKVTIGDDTIIESGTVIGACGFGHYRDENGNPVCVPHLGGVMIGHHVKIGAGNTISRGCLADTIIEDYVQTDNLCHIAHNDHIKRGAMLTACAEISGSVTIGENVWLGPGTCVNNSIEIGAECRTGIGTVVTKSQPENKVLVGVPARILRDRYETKENL